MSRAKKSAKATGIKKDAPAAPSQPIPTPTPPGDLPLIGEKTVSAPALARRLFRFDLVLLGVVAVLAFLLGSFTAHNTDLYLHLGLGNPFDAVGEGDAASWPHHAWLPSLVAGAIYEPYSDSAEVAGRYLVAAKAVVVVLLAVVLCLIRRPGHSWLLPILCGGLAVLVASPRLQLEPFVLSLVCLGVTVFVLTLPPARYPRAVWWLPALFALWVNLDQWFLLGPLTVALFLVGELLQRKLALPAAADTVTTPQRLKQLGWVTLAGVGACLVNPWLFQAFLLPAELGYLVVSILGALPDFLVGAGRTVYLAHKYDPQFFAQPSPFSPDYWARPSVGQHSAGLAYFVLLALGIASFVLPAYFLKRASELPAHAKSARAGFTFPLFTIFLFFALLSILTYRLVPLFAVVAGPIAALNFQDYLRRRWPAGNYLSKYELNWAVGSRATALMVGVLLVVAAWGGWLHAHSDEWKSSRHAAWAVDEDPGIRQAATTIAKIHEHSGGLLKRGLCYSVEGGNVFAWSRYQDSQPLHLFYDGRLSLPGELAEAYGKIRKGLREEAELRFSPPPTNPADEQQVRKKIFEARDTYQREMRRNGIDHVVVTGAHSDPAAQRIATWLRIDTQQWAVLYNDGRNAVFGWLDPGRKDDPFTRYRFDLNPLAVPASFPPNVPMVKLKPGVPPVPTEARGEWELFLTGPVKPALSSFEPAEYRALYDLAARIKQGEAFIGVAATTGGPAAIVSTRVTKDYGPPGALILGVRAARNGVLESPFDAGSYVQLAQAYDALFRFQEEFWVARPQPGGEFFKPSSLRQRFRRAQFTTAWYHARLLQPNDWAFHQALGQLYLGFNYLDLGVEHLTRAKELIATYKGGTREQAQEIKQAKDALDYQVKGLSEQLKARLGDFKLATDRPLDPVSKFELALYDPTMKSKDASGKEISGGPRGLVQLGLKILLEAKSLDKLDAEKRHKLIAWQLHLLLMTGQLKEVHERLKVPDLRKALAPGEYEEYAAMAAGVLGDYEAADKYLAEAETARQLPADAKLIEDDKGPTRKLLGLLASTAFWIPGPDGLEGASSRLGASLVQQEALLKELRKLSQERADVAQVRLMRGLLALEAGKVADAARHFRGCLRILPAVASMPDQVIAQRYLELLEGK